MKMTSVCAFIAALLLFQGSASGQDQKPAVPTEKTIPTTAAPLNDAEQKFKDLLTNVTMEGRWAPIEDGKLGGEKQDKYVITSATKIKSNSWVINTRMKYGEREVNLPFPVEVQWAGNTPVIVVDNLAIPGGKMYSARVLFYQNTYAGSWTGGEHGGLLNGVITKNK